MFSRNPLRIPGFLVLALGGLLNAATPSIGFSQEKETVPENARAEAAQDEPDSEKDGLDMEALFKKFSDDLSGSRFDGSFTITGQDMTKLTEEQYHIKSVQKMEAEGMWLFTARIKYGKNDWSVPLPLKVEWAGDTPVITLTNFRFLGQGPFSARVVIYEGKYAGTWSHGPVGGHLFGTITPDAAEGVDVKEQRDDDAPAAESSSRDGDRDRDTAEGDGDN